MDPLNAPLVIAWAIFGLISVLLGGCLRTNSYDEPVYYNPAPFYGAPPAAPAMPAYFQPRQPVVTCFRNGNFTYCS